MYTYNIAQMEEETFIICTLSFFPLQLYILILLRIFNAQFESQMYFCKNVPLMELKKLL